MPIDGEGGAQLRPRLNYRREEMTISGLITEVKEEKPNTFTDEKLLSFINKIEYEVAERLCDDFEPYTSIDDTELLAADPYSNLYVSYVKAKIDFANEEYASYQLNQAQHIQDFRDFIDWVVRTGQAIESSIPSRFRNIM